MSSVVVALVVLGLVWAPVGTAPQAPNSGAGLLQGRWDVTFDIPEQRYRTIIEMVVSEGGQITAVNLGYPLLQLKEATLSGNVLALKGTSPYGPIQVRATLDGDRMSGRWQVGLLGGETRGAREKMPSSGGRRLDVFDAVWAAVNERFYDPAFNGVDWLGLRSRYRTQAQAAHTDSDLAAVVRGLLGELHSSHMGFSALPLAQSLTPVASKTQGVASAAIVVKRLTPAVGYLQVKRFDESPEIVAAVDRAFAEIAALPSLIIDLRGNPGGTLSAAMRIGDYLFTARRPVGYFATREGLRRLKASSIDQLEPATLSAYDGYSVEDFRQQLDRSGALAIMTGGRATPYRGRVALLIDERSGSTTEALAGVVKETHAATLIGRRTAGGMLSSAEIPIVGGWTLRLPEADFRTPNRARIEGRGVEPDVEVARQTGTTDADVERALSILASSGRQATPRFPSVLPDCVLGSANRETIRFE